MKETVRRSSHKPGSEMPDGEAHRNEPSSIGPKQARNPQDQRARYTTEASYWRQSPVYLEDSGVPCTGCQTGAANSCTMNTRPTETGFAATWERAR